jgi:hypothetical protein
MMLHGAFTDVESSIHLSSAAELGDVARNIFVHLVSGAPVGINVELAAT